MLMWQYNQDVSVWLKGLVYMLRQQEQPLAH